MKTKQTKKQNDEKNGSFLNVIFKTVKRVTIYKLILFLINQWYIMFKLISLHFIERQKKTKKEKNARTRSQMIIIMVTFINFQFSIRIYNYIISSTNLQEYL